MTTIHTDNRENEEPPRSDGAGSAFLPRTDKGQRASGAHTSLTAALRSGQLGRRSSMPTESPPLAMGSSVLVLEQEDSPDMREGGGVSPMPSQLTQQTQFTRQRPRFHTVQDLDMALNQAIEGKINSKNAWASKEASNLLEGITHTIESTLEAHTSDDYSGFAKAATVVEGCSKVWTVRVDSTYNRSNQMVQRLLRNDNDDDGGGAAEGGGDGSDGMSREAADGLGISSWGGAGGGGHRSRARGGRAPLARTVVAEASEINLDAKARAGLCQVGVKAQFRALTEKFDQANAQGLLMSNAPLGRCANYIIDVDYSREPGAVADAAAAATTSASSETDSTRVRGSVILDTATDVVALFSSLPEYNVSQLLGHPFTEAAAHTRARHSATHGDNEETQQKQQQAREHGDALMPLHTTAGTETESHHSSRISSSKPANTTVVSLAPHLDAEEWRALLRRFIGPTAADPVIPSHRLGPSRSSHLAAAAGEEPPPPHTLPLPHTSTEADGGATAPRTSAWQAPGESASLCHTAEPLPLRNVDTSDMYHGESERHAGDATHAAEGTHAHAHATSTSTTTMPGVDEASANHANEDDASDDLDDGNAYDSADNEEPNHAYEQVAEEDGNEAQRFLRARDLVSGVAELEAMDELFPHRFALEADDPTAWCPLSAGAVGEREDVVAAGMGSGRSESGRWWASSTPMMNSALAKAGYAGLTPRCELARLHRESRVGCGGAAAAVQTGAAGSLLQQQQQQPPSTNARRARTVVFDLPDSDGKGTSWPWSSSVTFSLPGDIAKSAMSSSSMHSTCSHRNGNTNEWTLKASDTLKQSTTATRNMTALGKEVLLGPGAASAVLLYTQSTVQRSRAEQAGLLLPAAPVPGETIPSYLPYPIRVSTTFFQPFSTAVTAWSLLRKSAAGALVPHSHTHSHTRNQRLRAAAGDAAGHHGADRSDTAALRRSAHRTALSDEDEAEDMPMDVFLRGSAAVAGGRPTERTATGGADDDWYDDDADDMGGNHDFDGDEDGDSAEEAAYCASVAQTERQLLAQFNAIHDAACATTATAVNMSAWPTHSTHSTNTLPPTATDTATTNTCEDALRACDDATLLSFLRNADGGGSTPNNMDVGALRQRMWLALRSALQQRGWVLAAEEEEAEEERAARERALQQDEHTAAADRFTDTEQETRERREHDEEGEKGSGRPRGAMLKRHVSAALARARGEAAEGARETNADAEKAADDAEARGAGRGVKRSRAAAAAEEEMTLGALCGVSEAATPTPAVPVTTDTDTSALMLSTLVCSVLPWVSTFSSAGSLSPAFVFFTILFLANEHNVVLSNVDTLDDLVIEGIAEEAAKAEAASARPQKRSRVRQARAQ